MIRDAFRNLYVPGATEYLPAHRMRSHPDFVPKPDCIAEIGRKIVGSILYTKVKLIAEDGSACDCLSFGPIAVHPAFQRRGIGRALIETTFEKTRKMGHQRIVIFGHPSNYVAGGLVSCKKMNVWQTAALHPNLRIRFILCSANHLNTQLNRYRVKSASV